jgi:ABC-2 type transport system permease protein
MYWRFILVQLRSQVQYRFNLFVEIISTAFVTATVFVSLALIFERFKNIAGWSLAEVAFLYGLIEVAFGVMDMVFSGFDPQNFGRQVRLGRFDQLLLRPINITLQVLGSEFIIRRLGRIFQGLIILFFASRFLQIDWSMLKLLYLPVVFISQVLFFGGLFIIGATITFWTLESIEVINILTYGGAEMMSYPMSIYPLGMRRFFTFIVPAIFLNYYPALFFLDKPDPLGMAPIGYFLAPIAGFGILAASLVFWRYGIRQYQSTGT